MTDFKKCTVLKDDKVTYSGDSIPMTNKLKQTCTIGYDGELNLDIEWHGAVGMDDLPKAGTKLYVIPPGYTLVPDDQLKDGSVAQKAFWHALEFCREGHNIRAHWEEYKDMPKNAKESS